MEQLPFSSYQVGMMLARDLATLGVEAFYISPGYRNAPLISGLITLTNVIRISCIDERQAGYRALGFAKATGKPAALICTSGTAAANYLPAVIEAKESGTPLIVITADRPFDLIGTHSNQVMNQRQVFSHFSQETMSLPDSINWGNIQAIRHKIANAIQNNNPKDGPIHLNVPLKEPLEPEDKRHLKFPPLPGFFSQSSILPRFSPELAAAIQSAARPICLIGDLSTEKDSPFVFASLQKCKWPTYTDILSNLRQIPGVATLREDDQALKQRLTHYDPDLILHLGDKLVSKGINQLVQSLKPNCYIKVSSKPGVADPNGAFTHQVRSTPSAFLRVYNEAMQGLRLTPISHAAEIIPPEIWREVPLATASVAQSVQSMLPQNYRLVLGNSLTIRAFDKYSYDLPKEGIIFGNRGVSGIEGFISTTMGIADTTDATTVAVIGDITCLHDIGAMFSSQKPSNVKVVVINNSGGKIFDILPIANHRDVSEPYMTTPHNFSFGQVASAAGWSYWAAPTLPTFRQMFASLLKCEGPALLEAQIEPDADQKLANHLSARLSK